MRIPSAIYPFSPQLLPIVDKFTKLQSTYSLNAILSPIGLGLIGHDAGYACNKRNTNIIIAGEEDIDDSHWSAFHVFRSHVGLLHQTSQFKKIIEKTVKKGKSIVYYDFDMSNVSQEIIKLQRRFKDQFVIQGENTKLYDCYTNQEGFLKITTPVILVGGLLECSDILDVLLCLAMKFKNIGLHPAVVTKQPIGQLFGFHTLNHIFCSPCITESNKIFEMNRYLAAIEHYDCPDVIIVEAPDAVMKFNDIDPNGFGILSYMVSQAIRPDMFVCCVPIQLAVGKFIDKLSRDFRIRLGTPIHAVQVANIVTDADELNQTKKLSYVHVDQNLVQDQINKEGPNTQIPLFNIDCGDEENMFQHIVRIMKSI